MENAASFRNRAKGPVLLRLIMESGFLLGVEVHVGENAASFRNRAKGPG